MDFKAFSICQWNANGVLKKRQELSEFLERHDVSILMLTETHLKNGDRLYLPGYRCVRKDRQRAGGGGVALIIKGSICFQRLNLDNDEMKSEIVAVKVEIDGKEVVVCSAYRAPNKNISLDNINSTLCYENVLMGGDFNAKHQSWGSRINTSVGIKLRKIVDSTRATVHYPEDYTTCPTNNRRGDVIDIFITRGVHADKPKVLFELSSDHFPVCVNVAKYPSQLIAQQSKAINWNKFAYTMLDYKETPEPCHKKKLEFLENEIRAHMVTSEVLKSVTNPRGLDFEGRELIKRKNIQKNIWRRCRRPEEKARLMILQAEVDFMLKTHEENRWDETLSECGQADLWPILRRLRSRFEPNAPIRNPDGNGFTYKSEAKAEILAEHFEAQFVNRLPVDEFHSAQEEKQDHDRIKITPEELKTYCRNVNAKKATGIDGIPMRAIKLLPPAAIITLANIFNSFTEEGWYPEHWKKSVIVTIPKHGKDQTDVKNRRPISILPALSRIYEKTLVPHIAKQIETQKAVHPAQFGFSKGVGAVHQAAHLAGLCRVAEATRKKVFVALLDIEKAYDTVWREGLLGKMTAAGFSDELVEVVGRIISNRCFQVRVGDALSNERCAADGLPQGGPISPLLYNILVGDLPTFVGAEKYVKILQYADDTAIIAVGYTWSHAKRVLERTLQRMSEFCQQWRLKVNERKTEIFKVGAKLPKLTEVRWNGNYLPVKQSATYLGVTFCASLSWRMHLRRRGRFARSTLRKFHYVLTSGSVNLKTKRNIIKAVIEKQLMYGQEVWSEDPRFIPKEAYAVQRKAMRKITGFPYYVTSQDLRKSLELEDPYESARKRRASLKESLKQQGETYRRDVAKLLP